MIELENEVVGCFCLSGSLTSFMHGPSTKERHWFNLAWEPTKLGMTLAVCVEADSVKPCEMTHMPRI